MASPITLIGRFCGIASHNTTQGGVTLVNFRFVQDDRVKGDDGQWSDRKPELYLTVTASSSTAENLLASEPSPGARMTITGTLFQGKPYKRSLPLADNPNSTVEVMYPGAVEFRATDVACALKHGPVKVEKAPRSQGQSQGDSWGGQPTSQPQQTQQTQQGTPAPWGGNAPQQGQGDAGAPWGAQPSNQPQRQGGDPWSQPAPQQQGTPAPWGGNTPQQGASAPWSQPAPQQQGTPAPWGSSN